jgi:SAM-dependent methyltransferase
VDTSGVIPLKNLTIESDSKKEGIWYEPMSVNIFHQIMRNLNIDFTRFEFIDFGSGKGRVLLLASEYGFKKVIGVEFAKELHLIAGKNAAIYCLYKKRPNNIETICIDAMKFSLPDSPLVIFFYSPFRRMIMEKVLENLSRSLTSNPRKIILIFYGLNPDTISAIKSSNFQWKELELRSDWTRGTQYKCFLFTNSSS